MTRPEIRKFARIYYQEFKRDYPDIYADDLAWATWTKLLVGSEEAWPAMPELPRSIKSRPLRTLVERGLVTVTGHTYVLKGWVAERSKRQESARIAAAKRWDSDSNADAQPDAMPSTSTRQRTSTKEAEQERRPSEGRAPLAVVQP